MTSPALPIHRCTERDCPHLGQRTDRTCGCHKTTEQMLVEQRDALHAAAKALVDRDCHYTGGDIVIPCGTHGEALRSMRVLRDAVAKAEGA